MDGLVSYKHLNRVALEVLKDSDKKMSANQIYEKICSNFNTNKLRITPMRIAKRLSAMPQVSVSRSKRGINFYKYIR